MRFPTGGQFAAHRAAPLIRDVGEGFDILFDLLIPVLFLCPATIYRFTVMSQRFVRNKELRIFRPSERPLRLRNRLRTRSIRVRFSGSLRWQTKAYDRLN